MKKKLMAAIALCLFVWPGAESASALTLDFDGLGQANGTGIKSYTTYRSPIGSPYRDFIWGDWMAFYSDSDLATAPMGFSAHSGDTALAPTTAQGAYAIQSATGTTYDFNSLWITNLSEGQTSLNVDYLGFDSSGLKFNTGWMAEDVGFGQWKQVTLDDMLAYTPKLDATNLTSLQMCIYKGDFSDVAMFGVDDFTYNEPAGSAGVAPVPEPATVFMLGTGLLGFISFKKGRSADS